MKTLGAIVWTALVVFSVDAHAAGADQGDPPKTIIEAAIEVGTCNVFVAAIKTAGLVETFQGDAPFTLFAPTDEAFAKLPQGTITKLLQPENKKELVQILTHHFLPSKVLAEQAVALTEVKTVHGANLAIQRTDDKQMVGKATIVRKDLLCKNGVIHVIDTVLLPEKKRSCATLG